MFCRPRITLPRLASTAKNFQPRCKAAPCPRRTPASVWHRIARLSGLSRPSQPRPQQHVASDPQNRQTHDDASNIISRETRRHPSCCCTHPPHLKPLHRPCTGWLPRNHHRHFSVIDHRRNRTVHWTSRPFNFSKNIQRKQRRKHPANHPSCSIQRHTNQMAGCRRALTTPRPHSLDSRPQK